MYYLNPVDLTINEVHPQSTVFTDSLRLYLVNKGVRLRHTISRACEIQHNFDKYTKFYLRPDLVTDMPTIEESYKVLNLDFNDEYIGYVGATTSKSKMLKLLRGDRLRYRATYETLKQIPYLGYWVLPFDINAINSTKTVLRDITVENFIHYINVCRFFIDLSLSDDVGYFAIYASALGKTTVMFSSDKYYRIRHHFGNAVNVVGLYCTDNIEKNLKRLRTSLTKQEKVNLTTLDTLLVKCHEISS